MTTLANRPVQPSTAQDTAGMQSVYLSEVEAADEVPVHCGTPMTIRPAGTAEGVGIVGVVAAEQLAEDINILRTWECACGFLMDDRWMFVPDEGDEPSENVDVQSGEGVMTAIIAAAGAVESAEWELDRATLALTETIESAAAEGCTVSAIAAAAGLAMEEVSTIIWAARSGRGQP